MRALVTNDDGITSPGIRALAEAARDAGLGVTVAAPSWDSSGASASLTAVEKDGRLLVEHQRLDGLDDVAAFGVEAAPAFIVRAAIHGAFGEPPDIVLSGINNGHNTGYAVLHRGACDRRCQSLVHDDLLELDGQSAGHVSVAVCTHELRRPPRNRTFVPTGPGSHTPPAGLSRNGQRSGW